MVEVDQAVKSLGHLGLQFQVINLSRYLLPSMEVRDSIAKQGRPKEVEQNNQASSREGLTSSSK